MDAFARVAEKSKLQNGEVKTKKICTVFKLFTFYFRNLMLLYFFKKKCAITYSVHRHLLSNI